MKYQYSKEQTVPYNAEKYTRLRWLYNMYNRYEDYYRAEINHIIENQNFYWGRNYGQWPSFVIEYLKNQGRTPPQYNITATKIEKELGSFIANGFDMKWKTVSGVGSRWTNDLSDMALSDKRGCDWQTEEVIAMRDMKVCVGYERMFISDRFDSTFGNIAYEALPPTHIYIDPTWKTPHAWDIENYFEWGVFTPSQIIDMYPKISDELKDWKEREESTGINFGDYNAGVNRWQTTEQKWGDYHRVITFHHIKKYERKWEYDLINRCPFPETGFPEGSDEEKEAKRQYVQEAGLQEGQYTIVTQKKREKRIEVICPSLHNELFLSAGKDRVQTNNCNIYPLGNNFYGQYRGIVDDLRDLNRDFNKTGMDIQDMMRRTAKGSCVLDEALAGGNDAKKKEIEQRWSLPGSLIWVSEGTTQDLGAHGGIVELPSSQPTTEMFNYQQRTLSLADWLTTPAALDSRNDVPNASGKLFQSQVQVGLVGQQYPLSIIERHKKEKLMAYALQAKITYSGYPRTFERASKKNKTLEINTPGIDSSGKRIIINNISKMPEMMCTIVKSISGLDVRSELRDNYTAMINTLNDPKDRLPKLIVQEALASVQDGDDETKDELKQAFKILKTNAALEQAILYLQMSTQLSGAGVPPQQISQQQNNPEITEGSFSEDEAKNGTLQQMEAAV